MRRWVSLGGWCGPGLMLAKLGLGGVGEPLPFDMARCSFDGILEFIRNGFEDGFFPGPLSSRPFVADPASIWLLFRAQHTCITHFNLNSDNVIAEFYRRFAAWEKLLACPTEPVTFLRTCIAEDPRDEVELVPQLHLAIHQKSGGRLNFRTVMIVHDQGPMTTRIAAYSEKDAAGSPCIVWNLALDKKLPPESSLLDKCQEGYTQILHTMNHEGAWNFYSMPFAPESPRPYRNLCTVEGVPALRGSCTGFGTTHAALLGRCLYCGSTNGHQVVRDAFDTNRPWDDAENALLLDKLVETRGDEVAAVEAAALQLKRGANEVLLQLHKLSDC
ncbi:hypothetical protein TRVL_05910 [Trypanosoma vivax]|uniref:Uncharacterized protein n=1 Tax=Trypanosoma vivax (strain Y486) TaxID=1055687 RepID=G0TWW8_TRYVY|nr:hypothetical protein TRVL_05910 [Trypanosoma vivax]CCC48456.1 conserved hypothetical protein [Trypanosoma vivax Y486]